MPSWRYKLHPNVRAMPARGLGWTCSGARLRLAQMTRTIKEALLAVPGETAQSVAPIVEVSPCARLPALEPVNRPASKPDIPMNVAACALHLSTNHDQVLNGLGFDCETNPEDGAFQGVQLQDLKPLLGFRQLATVTVAQRGKPVRLLIQLGRHYVSLTAAPAPGAVPTPMPLPPPASSQPACLSTCASSPRCV